MPHSIPSLPRPAGPDLGELAHELNNSLAPILMSVEALRRRIADPAARTHLDLLAGRAWRGAALLRRIVALMAAADQSNQRAALPPRTALNASSVSPAEWASSSSRSQPGFSSSPGKRFKGKSEPKRMRSENFKKSSRAV